VTVVPITGNLPPEERAERIRGMDGLERYVLVCTDCLSEGINLQQYFDAVCTMTSPGTRRGTSSARDGSIALAR